MRKIVNKIEIKLQFSYVVLSQHEHHAAADTYFMIPLSIYKNNTIALNLNLAKNMMLLPGPPAGAIKYSYYGCYYNN